jgi:hypothetical protein
VLKHKFRPFRIVFFQKTHLPCLSVKLPVKAAPLQQQLAWQAAATAKAAWNKLNKAIVCWIFILEFRNDKDS